MIDYLSKYMIDIRIGIKSETKTNNEDNIKIDDRNLENLNFEIINNDILLLSPYYTKNRVLKDIKSIIEFNMKKSSLLVALAVAIINSRF